MYRIFRNPVSLAAIIGVSALTALAGSAQAQDADTFDVTVTTNAAVAIDCGANVSFGAVYVTATNAQSVITLTSGGATSSSDASVAVTGGAAGACTVSGLQGADTANIVLSGGGGTPVSGGLSGVTLEDGANTLTATIAVNGGTPISGGTSALANGAAAIHGTVTIPASHTLFGTYDATLTATVALD